MIGRPGRRARSWPAWGLVAAVAAGCGPARDRGPSTRPSAGATTNAGPIDAGPPPLAPDAAPADPLARARALTERLILVDGHVDLPWRLEEARAAGAPPDDVAGRTARGDFDAPRARQGGLDAPFMSIYVPAEVAERRGAARAKADQLIDQVEAIIAAAPATFAAARSPDEIVANSARGLISLPLGIENGSALERDLGNVQHFHDRGVRYVTLTHSRSNAICDSSYDKKRRWKGLSPFGKRIVAEMNRVGIMVDVSHVSDEAFRQAVALSVVPVIASHSSARHFTPGFERNPSDELIQLLAGKGGVVMVNFGSTFISAASRRSSDEADAAIAAYAKAHDLGEEHADVVAFAAAYRTEHPLVLASAKDVADHIEHIVKLVGVDHVGLGSDYDGVGDSMPRDLRDVAAYPTLFAELLARGWSEDELARLASGNVLRVWRAVEAHAAASRTR